MVKIATLMEEGKVARINELELQRYVNFFDNSYKDNLEHCKAVMLTYPRWSIISGYYAMHDITKLLLAKKFMIKVEYEVHSTTIKALAALTRNREIVGIIRKGYKEFITLANDLAEAKGERVKTQYYTGTEFMKTEYGKRASLFLKDLAEPYIRKVKLFGGMEND